MHAAPYPRSTDRAATHRRLEALTRLMDTALRVPGTRWRFGLDAILDAVPGIGDVIGKAIAGYLIFEAHQLGVPRLLLARMVKNVLIDLAAGAVPGVGVVLGAAWKCNVKNLRLLDDWLRAEAARGSPMPRTRV